MTLLPCPCCGAKAVFGTVTAEGHENSGAMFVDCTRCGLSTNLMWPLKDDVRGELAERWNKRVTYVPPRLLDDGEVQKLARKVAMPTYMYDTSEARLYLASFFNQASIFISLPRP